MKFNLDNAIPILARTPLVLKSLLKDLPEDWTHQNEGDETWSPFDVLGHLIHGEQTDWMVRAGLILGDNDDKTFESFDRFAQFERNKGKTMDQLLDEFELLRAENLAKLTSLKITDEQLKREGIHPELGKVDLEQLLATWVVHDLDHIHQISRVMASQYQSEVGPWRGYIGVLS